MRSKIIALIVTLISLATPAIAGIIHVGGTSIKIPNAYNQSRIEGKANQCFNRKITQVQSDRAADLLALSCVSEQLRRGDKAIVVEE